MDKFQGNPQQN